LYENINEDIKSKHIQLSTLKKELGEVRKQDAVRNDIGEWLTSKDNSELHLVNAGLRTSQIVTQNYMKFELLHTAPKTDFTMTADYKNSFSVFKIQNPEVFFKNVVCTLNEIARQALYRIKKIQEISNSSSHCSGLLKGGNSKLSRQSQEKVDYFLKKLKKAAEKTYLELVTKQTDKFLVAQSLSNYDNVSKSLSNVQFNVKVRNEC